jgi:hypothetical protein
VLLEAAGFPKGWAAGVRKGRRLWAVGWRRGRLVLVHESENQKQGGRLCFFLFKGRERPEEEDEMGLGFFVFRFFFLKNCPLLNIFLPQCIWLEVHLYRKSLHMLFKEILQ